MKTCRLHRFVAVGIGVKLCWNKKSSAMVRPCVRVPDVPSPICFLFECDTVAATMYLLFPLGLPLHTKYKGMKKDSCITHARSNASSIRICFWHHLSICLPWRLLHIQLPLFPYPVTLVSGSSTSMPRFLISFRLIIFLNNWNKLSYSGTKFYSNKWNIYS